MYVQSMANLIQLNFLPLVTVLFMGFFLIINKKYEPTLTAFFKSMFFLLVILIATDNIDYYMHDIALSNMWRKIVVVIGYNMRICILLRLMTITEYNITDRVHRVVIIPMIINFCILLLSFQTKLVFWYDDIGRQVRGPLGYSPHITMFVYLIYGCYLAYLAFKKGQKDESYIILIEEVLCVFGTLAELNYSVRGILIGIIALDITFYYLYLHICKFHTDSLTGALNRASFYADMHRYSSKITAIYSIDLNGLKEINDTKGHQAGDALLKDFVRTMQNVLMSHCYFYRTGGDEFVILCIGLNKTQISQMTGRLSHMQHNGCDFAFGMSEVKGDPNNMFRLADDAMYVNKRNMKAK